VNVDPTRPAHGATVYKGRGTPLRLVDLPPWHGWTYKSEAARSRRFMERFLIVPTGAGAAHPLRVAGFQRTILETLYSHVATFASLPAANGKTTFLAAVALERLCRGDDYATIDVVATKQEQAGILVEAAKRMVESCPDLVDRVRWHVREQILEYRPTGSRLQAHPARLSAVQGLNFSLAIVDEVGFAHDETVESLIARLGKRPDARLIGIGTPGFDPNILHRLRGAAIDGALPDGVAYLEWSADQSADTMDRRAWRQANPALRAGFLTPRALEVQAGLLSQREFRTYHLGIWTDQTAPWLPVGAWDACPEAAPPPAGAEVVLAVEGTFRRTMSIVGATFDGALFHGWSAEAALDKDVRGVIERAASHWDVRAVVHSKRIRPALFRDLREDGIPCEPWDASPDNEATSATEFYRAIVGQESGVRLAHDHDETIAAHMGSIRARYGVDGSLRLVRPDDGRFADAAIAARNAWWVAGALADTADGPMIY
jgi:hypothetical protein